MILNRIILMAWIDYSVYEKKKNKQKENLVQWITELCSIQRDQNRTLETSLLVL